MNLISKVSAYMLLMLLVTSCGDEATLEENVEENEDGSKTVSVISSAVVPILPINLPIYPTSLTLAGLADSVHAKTETYIDNFIDSDISSFLKPVIVAAAKQAIGKEAIQTGVDSLESALADISSSILSPGTLSTSVKNQIGSLDNVEITKVGMKMKLKNSTSQYVAVPARFRLFLGNKTEVEEKSEDVAIDLNKDVANDTKTETGSASEGTLTEDKYKLVKPDGISEAFEIENIPHLVVLLNKILSQDSESEIGLSYANDYFVADASNGADIPGLVTKVGGCIFSKGLKAASGIDLSKFNFPDDLCPAYDQLLAWRVDIESLELIIEAKTELLTVPAVPSCKELAEKLDLSKYGEACDFVKAE